MNWGKKILVLYIGFVTMIMFLVYRSVHTKIDLVSADYYAKELKYQDIINGVANANKLSESVTVERTASDIVIRFPAEQAGKISKGSAYFYAPADNRLDTETGLQPDDKGIQLIARSKVKPGSYIVKISWECEGKAFYTEQSLSVF